MLVGAMWYLDDLTLPGLGTLATVTARRVLPPADAVPPSSTSDRAQAASESARPPTAIATVVAADLPVSLRLDAQLAHTPEPMVAMPPPKTQPQQPVAMTKSLPQGTLARSELSPRVPTLAPTKALTESAPASASQPVPGATVTGPTATPALADATQLAQRRNAAARDALAQAQTLWHAGNLGAATDLLREALQVALRTSAASTSLDSIQAAMLRELVRMQMGAAHVAEAHALLVQHEARYGGQAELWALRANAAQRLGQHQDSVQSYMQALQTRPNEQRWLLGMAVSLAAMGQIEAANGVTERARAQGVIAREIADYLHQLGVTVK
jgi:tetratricopeptide (TPR) repeat protein